MIRCVWQRTFAITGDSSVKLFFVAPRSNLSDICQPQLKHHLPGHLHLEVCGKKNMAILGAFFGSLLVACYPKKLVFRKRSPQGCARWHANSFFRFEQSILRQRSWTQPRIDNLKIWWSWYIILSIKIWQRILQKTTLGTLPDDELSSLLPSVQTKEIKAVRDSTELRAMLWAANSPTLSHCPLTLSMASLESLLHTQKAILYYIISYKYRLSKEV